MRQQNHSTPCVYVLVDPVTEQVRYVGSTVTTLISKKAIHIFDSKKFNHPTAIWIRHLKANNLTPKIEVLEYCPAEERRQLEEFYIRYLNYLGVELTNTTHLRQSMNRAKKLSDDHREKLSKSKIGKTVINNRKKIHQFTLDGVFIKEWKGVIQAQKEMNCKSISVTIKKHGRAAGYLWRYVD